MCRNIKTLYNFDPPVSESEIQAAALQFVRKISGFNRPSKANEPAFQAAVADIARISERLLNTLETNHPPKDREIEAARAKARSARRFGAERLAGLPIDQVPGLSNPARRALSAAGFTNLEQLSGARETELMQLHGFGKKGLDALRQALAERGLTFALEE